MKKLLAILGMAITLVSGAATYKTVQTDTNNQVALPTGFWPSNAAAIKALIPATTNVDYATNAGGATYSTNTPAGQPVASTNLVDSATNTLDTALSAKIQNSTNDLNTTLTNLVKNATNSLNTSLTNLVKNATNDLNTAIGNRGYLTASATNDLNTSLTNLVKNATNSLNTSLTNLVKNATNDLNTTLSTKIQNATNDLNSTIASTYVKKAGANITIGDLTGEDYGSAVRIDSTASMTWITNSLTLVPRPGSDYPSFNVVGDVPDKTTIIADGFGVGSGYYTNTTIASTNYFLVGRTGEERIYRYYDGNDGLYKLYMINNGGDVAYSLTPLTQPDGMDGTWEQVNESGPGYTAYATKAGIAFGVANGSWFGDAYELKNINGANVIGNVPRASFAEQANNAYWADSSGSSGYAENAGNTQTLLSNETADPAVSVGNAGTSLMISPGFSQEVQRIKFHDQNSTVSFGIRYGPLSPGVTVQYSSYEGANGSYTNPIARFDTGLATWFTNWTKGTYNLEYSYDGYVTNRNGNFGNTVLIYQSGEEPLLYGQSEIMEAVAQLYLFSDDSTDGNYNITTPPQIGFDVSGELWHNAAAFSTSPSTNSPAANEFVTKQWVISQTPANSTNAVNATWAANATNAASATNVVWAQQILDPTGWVNNDALGTFLLTSNTSTYTLTFTNGGTNMTLLMNGVSTNYTGITATIPTNRGLYFISITNGGSSVVVSTNAWSLSDAQIATVFCDTNGMALISRETHGANMPWSVHRRFHSSAADSSAWANGLAVTASLTNLTVVGGQFFDEDILHTLTTKTNPLICVGDGSAYMTYKTAQLGRPYWTNSATSKIQYNVGGTNLADVSANQFMSVWVWATPILTNPIVCVLGRSQFSSAANAQGDTPPALAPSFAASEAVLLAQLIYKQAGSIVYDSMIDYRTAKVTGSGATVGAGGSYSDSIGGSITLANGLVQSFISATGNGLSLTNLQGTNMVNTAIWMTNANNGVVVDATQSYQLFITNATYTVSGFSGLISGYQHIMSMTVSNSSGSPISWNGPPTAFYFGSASTNVLSIPAGKEAIIDFWIWPNKRTNVVNKVQQ